MVEAHIQLQNRVNASNSRHVLLYFYIINLVYVLTHQYILTRGLWYVSFLVEIVFKETQQIDYFVDTSIPTVYNWIC